VVVAGKDVSRRHAEILQTPKGYVVVDSSTNGTFVNEERVEGQRILARADVIRLGDEQFRFYVDVAPATAVPPPPPLPPPPPGPAASPPQAVPPAGAADRLRHTVHGLEAFVPASPRSVAGGGGGGGAGGRRVRELPRAQRWALRPPPVSEDTRGQHRAGRVQRPRRTRSVRLHQPREAAAKGRGLGARGPRFHQRHVRGWGAGEGARPPLAPGAAVRFGDVQLVFEPTDDAVPVAKGGGTQLLRTPHSVAPNAPPTAAPSPAPPLHPRAAPPQGPRPRQRGGPSRRRR